MKEPEEIQAEPNTNAVVETAGRPAPDQHVTTKTVETEKQPGQLDRVTNQKRSTNKPKAK
jgi:hypothetical protein